MRLAAIVGKGCTPELAESVMHMFSVSDGRLRHERLDEERRKQDKNRKKRSEAGKKSGEARRSSGDESTPIERVNESGTSVEQVLNNSATSDERTHVEQVLNNVRTNDEQCSNTTRTKTNSSSATASATASSIATTSSKRAEGSNSPARAGPPPFDGLVEVWNEVARANGLPEVRSLTDKRRKALKARWVKPEWRAHWREALAKIPDSSFLTGVNARGWRADLDWFLRPDTVQRILEGAYDNATARQSTDSFLDGLARGTS